MIRIVVLYPNTNQNWFNREYYTCHHIPLAMENLEPYGLKKFEFDIGIAGMEGPAPYLAIGYLTFTSLDHFQKGMAAKGKILMDDMSNYTRDVIVQIGETVELLKTT